MYDENLFVYGTLQPHGSLYRMISEAVISTEPARLLHHGIYRSRWGVYPEAYPLQDHEVKGTLMRVNMYSSQWVEVISMEVGSGYKLQQEQVLTNHGMLIPSFVFIAKDEPQGFLIESGDFNHYLRSLGQMA